MPKSRAAPAHGGWYIGLMSGTSLDGVDALAVHLDATALRGLGGRALRTSSFVSIDFPGDLRERLLSLQQSGPDELARSAQAANALADCYARAVRTLLERDGLRREEIIALGAHGQTVRHRPELGWTSQLLNGARLALATGITTVCDFRSADVAAGGQGAPLAPAFHAAVFADARKRRAVVNLGGIANVTWLAPGEPVIGFDTGPANVLLDGWIQRHRGQEFDRDGAWSASGQIHSGLLEQFLREPYFALPAPKSTGRDLFEAAWLDRQLAAFGTPLAAADVQATLAELTALTVARACLEGRADEVFVCGGGEQNADLMGRLANRLAPAPVRSTEVLGVPPKAVEALAFGWLAFRRLHGAPGNLPSVTGATTSCVLGAVHAAPPVGDDQGTTAT